MLALACNRHAAAEIRRRLEALIGDDARAVRMLTCHGFAMRLVGASFASRAEPLDDDAFRDVMKQAVALRVVPSGDTIELTESAARYLKLRGWIVPVTRPQSPSPEPTSPAEPPRRQTRCRSKSSGSCR